MVELPVSRSTRQGGLELPGVQTARHQADPRHATSADSSLANRSQSPSFVSRSLLLELFLDEMHISARLRRSQMLQSSFTSALSNLTHGGGEYTNVSRMLHVLAILRRVSLKTLHRATGWQTNMDQMLRSRAEVRDFFRDQPREARRCLWHATCIFSETWNTRLLACYDTFSVMVSTCYLFCHSELHPASHAQNVNLSRSRHSLQQEPVVRLDRLRDRSSIEQ
jgi:hypothetical protein